MASTDPQVILSEARCYECSIPTGLAWYVVLSSLITVANGGIVSTDPQVLINEARCYACIIPPGFLPYAILNAVSGISGGAGGSGVTCGNYAGGQPTFVPASGCAVAVDTSTEQVWWYYSGAWH